MSEKALAVPFTGDEIAEILAQEYKKRLRTLGPLQNNKEYTGFEASFESRIKLFRLSGNGGGDKDTLAWGGVAQGEGVEDSTIQDTAEFKSDPDVNQERLDHDMPLSVETSDGKGNKVTKKVRVKDDKR